MYCCTWFREKMYGWNVPGIVSKWVLHVRLHLYKKVECHCSIIRYIRPQILMIEFLLYTAFLYIQKKSMHPTHHSIASSSPSPLMADVLNIWYRRFLMAERPRAFATSVTVIAPSMSCLLAKMQRTDFFSSSSYRRTTPEIQWTFHYNATIGTLNVTRYLYYELVLS